MESTHHTHPLIVIGAGAAGLMTAIHAGRGGVQGVLALDGSRAIGIKILVAGGGRCNVTHHSVHERDFAGSTPASIRRVLNRFTATHCVQFFADLGVELKQEDTGKLFPVTDDAHTVLDALLRAARQAGVQLRHPQRVQNVQVLPSGEFQIHSDGTVLRADRVVLATGGRSLPKSGSDGAGLAIATSLGHSLTPHMIPSLVPLLLHEGHWLRSLSGVSAPVELKIVSGQGKRLHSCRGAMLCTHFGISGPVTLDISRHWTLHQAQDASSRLQANFLPDMTEESVDRWLLAGTGRTVLSRLRESFPDRLAKGLLAEAAIDADATTQGIDRTLRRELVRTLTALELPVVGDRGFIHAEATAGGVPLKEIHLETMESRVHRGLYVVGEILDVDGRIGGFNFQWAWSSGFVAGTAVAKRVAESRA